MDYVNVLGQRYEIIRRKPEEDHKLDDANGYIEPYSKKIVLEEVAPDSKTVERLERFEAKVLRHEIVHAFLEESGLAENSNWARNEELVDGIAKQGPKVCEAWKAAEAL